MDTNIFRSIATVDKSWLSLQSAKIQFFGNHQPDGEGCKCSSFNGAKSKEIKIFNLFKLVIL
jgi:hypothetical protein